MRVLKISYFILVLLSIAIIMWYWFYGRHLLNSVPDTTDQAINTVEYQITRIEEPVYDSLSEITVVESETAVEVEPTFYLTEYERSIVEKVVMGESGSEPYEGQVAVAQCILNACLKDDIQPSEVRVKYQYSGWNDDPSQSVKDVVSAVFDSGYTIVDEPILYFYAPKLCKSDWHETQVHVTTIGGHKFFKEHNDWR